MIFTCITIVITCILFIITLIVAIISVYVTFKIYTSIELKTRIDKFWVAHEETINQIVEDFDKKEIKDDLVPSNLSETTEDSSNREIIGEE